MSGNKRRRGVVLQNRDRHLLSELGVMRIIDREMTKVVAGFGTTTQVNKRLIELTRAGLLRRFFVGTIGSGRKAIYTLSPKGAGLIQSKFGSIHRPSDKLVTADAFVAHQMAINEIYLAVKYRPLPDLGIRLVRWHTFRQPISDAINLTPDGYFEIASGGGVHPMFLEVDLGTEALAVWRRKTASYLQLAVSGEFQKIFHQPQFRVLVITGSDRRLATIRSTVAKSTGKIFRFTTFDIIHRDSLRSPVWLRPTGDQRLPLL
jgi:hypothetical protein